MAAISGNETVTKAPNGASGFADGERKLRPGEKAKNYVAEKQAERLAQTNIHKPTGTKGRDGDPGVDLDRTSIHTAAKTEPKKTAAAQPEQGQGQTVAGYDIPPGIKFGPGAQGKPGDLSKLAQLDDKNGYNVNPPVDQARFKIGQRQDEEGRLAVDITNPGIMKNVYG